MLQNSGRNRLRPIMGTISPMSHDLPASDDMLGRFPHDPAYLGPLRALPAEWVAGVSVAIAVSLGNACVHAAALVFATQ